MGSRSLGGGAIAEARVGPAGPILGALACAALLPVAIATDDPFWRPLVFTGVFPNLFAVRRRPRDGRHGTVDVVRRLRGDARVLQAFPNPILVLFLLLGGMESWRRWNARRRGEEGNAAYYGVTSRERLAVGAAYVGLVALPAIGMVPSFVDRSDRL